MRTLTKTYTVSINGREHSVVIDGNEAIVDGRSYTIDVKEGAARVPVPGPAPRSAPAAPRPAPVPVVPAASAAAAEGVVYPAGTFPVEAPMAGVVLEILVEVGQRVTAGETLLMLEAMKMEIEIKAVAGGTVSDISVSVGDQAAASQVVMLIDG